MNESFDESHVLVVEDEDVLRLTFQQFLEEEGYCVAAAPTYGEALRLLDEETFDVVVTDILLEGDSGVDLLRRVREHDPKCLVIMVTGKPSVDTAAEAVRHGAFDYLPKPVTGQDLKRVVRLALEQKRLAGERDRFAAKMDEYRRDLEAIFTSVADGIITVDATLCARQVNPAAGEMLGQDAEVLINRSVDKVLPGALQPFYNALVQSVQSGAIVSDIRVSHLLDKTTTKILIGQAVPLIESGGIQAGAALVLRDITRLTALEKRLTQGNRYQDLIGKSSNMCKTFDLIERLSATDSTVLVCGESGTGKELVAGAVHNTSGRSDGPFLKVNCAALADDILESELFGHVKGAFTGADRDRVGRFEASDGGTIMLDEIGDISPRLQVRLLRVLQDGEFERVGSSYPTRTNVRVIACTNQDLPEKIESGEFRQDLYFRLNVIRIDIPPLRERLEDIPLLLDHFRRHFNALFKREITGFSEEAMALLIRYPWPGNVRELENCVERSFIVCSDTIVSTDDLPPEVTQAAPDIARLRAKPLTDDGEAERILAVLTQTDWNLAKSARLLGIARNTLYHRIETLRLTRPSKP
jgi:PAS domain S-box-containing protein